MAKISAKSNDFLKEAKKNTSSKIYSTLVDLVNQGLEDLADEVLKVDYLLEYTSRAIKQKDLSEAKDSLSKAKARIDALREKGADASYLEYLYEGISKKIK